MGSSDGAILHPTGNASATVPEHHGAREAPIGTGARVGRYVLLDAVGEGAMGRVYRAYDPKLRREVALKRLRVAGADAQARMMREAQAMAQLAHPNVVPVYDVDVEAGDLHIAMEYVEGRTLDRWLADESRSWRDILAVFEEAGEGLHAAHRQGIVHRDFKPANVIVGLDGRTRVMDFGVARSVPGSSSARGSEDEPASSSIDLPLDHDGDLTELGTVVGTPAYMAPEQHAGEPTDARTDQYAFCIALWEALFGERPFTGTNLEALAAAKLRSPPKPPAGTGVPTAVHAAIVRGLSVVADERWADMDALLTALRRTQAGRRRWPWVGVGALGLAFVGLVAFRPDTPCRQGEEEIDTVWSENARARVHAGLEDSGVGFAASTVARVDAALDAYAADFAAMHREACEATRVHHQQSAAALDLRMACLASRRESLRTAVSLLAAADDVVAQKAVELATGLEPISGCGDLRALQSRTPLPPDPEAARRVDQARGVLARARVSLDAGRHADAIANVTEVRAVADELDYEPLRAESLLVHGLALLSASEDHAAREKIEEALRSALRLSLQHLGAEAAVSLHELLAAREGKSADATWLAHAALAMAEGDGSDPSLTARAMLQVGGLYAADEDVKAAEPYFDRAVALVEGSLGPEHPSMVPVLTSWVSLQGFLGRHEEAGEALTRARDLAERAFGPDHPATAGVIQQQAWREMSAGRFAEAEVKFEEARAILEGALGPDHPTTAGLLASMAGSLAEQGRLDEAAALLVRAEKGLRNEIVADHPLRASLWHNLGSVRMLQDRFEDAADHYRQAVEIRRRLGMKHDLAAGLTGLARALLALERWDDAEKVLLEADALQIELQERFGSRSALPPLELGRLARRRGDLKAAQDHLEDALTFADPVTNVAERADASLELGKTLWELGADRVRAFGLVEQSLELALASDGNHTTAIAEEARVWLDAHQPPR